MAANLYYFYPNYIDSYNRIHYSVINTLKNTEEDELLVRRNGEVLESTKGFFSTYEEYWNRYKTTDEYRCINFDIPESTRECVDLYKSILRGSILLRALKDKNNYDDYTIIQEKSDKLTIRATNWLNTTDFYIAPASTRFHDSYPSGLLLHTLRVVNNTVDLLKVNKFSSRNINIGSAILCSCIHDWCKIGLYESYKRNVKNEATGAWEQVTAFKTRPDTMINLGHGVSSAYLGGQFFHLTLKEYEAVRWHMGHWRVANDDVNELQTCNENNPLVHLIQFADQLAIVNY